MSITGLVTPWRYRKALPASQPDKSESASESSTSGTFSGQFPGTSRNPPEPGQHPSMLHLNVSMCAWTSGCLRPGSLQGSG